MRRITAVEPAADAAAADTVRLDYDQRSRRRMVYTTEAGAPILLDMLRPVHLRGGDLLRLDDGSLVRVEATVEALTEIAARSVDALVRIAWHLGNRHLPTQLVPGPEGGGGRLRIRQDHVIAEMAKGLGGTCEPVLAPFDPEGGAYAAERDAHDHAGDQHRHGDGHGHAHPHG